MNFKIDENVPPEVLTLLRSALHDAMTVMQQGLSGAPDNEIQRICAEEKRALITCDLDFQNVKRYPPDKSAGIVVLHVKQNKPNILAAIRRILPFLYEANLRGRTWIVGESSLRIR